jgi:hypothetical protein
MTHLNAPSRHFLIAIATWRLAGKYPERRGALLFFDRVEKHIRIKRCFQLEIRSLMAMRTGATARGNRLPAARRGKLSITI